MHGLIILDGISYKKVNQYIYPAWKICHVMQRYNQQKIASIMETVNASISTIVNSIKNFNLPEKIPANDTENVYWG